MCFHCGYLAVLQEWAVLRSVTIKVHFASPSGYPSLTECGMSSMGDTIMDTALSHVLPPDTGAMQFLAQIGTTEHGAFFGKSPDPFTEHSHVPVITQQVIE